MVFVKMYFRTRHSGRDSHLPAGIDIINKVETIKKQAHRGLDKAMLKANNTLFLRNRDEIVSEIGAEFLLNVKACNAKDEQKGTLISDVIKFLFLTILIALSGVTLAGAKECPVLRLQQARSPGTTVIGSQCTNKEELSLGAQIQMQPGARFWMESVAGAGGAQFQLICQNNSSATLTINVAQPIMPWLQPQAPVSCTTWQTNRLSCSTPGMDNKALLCAISTKKQPPASGNIQRTTSVTMRGLSDHNASGSADEDEPARMDEWLGMIKSEIDLCRMVYQTEQPITLSWKVKASGQAMDTSVKETMVDNKFAACAVDAINHFSFPTFSKDTLVTFSF